MPLVPLSIALIMVILAASIAYQLGGENGAFLGAIIAALLSILAMPRPAQIILGYFGVIWTFVVLFGAGFLLSDNGLVWSLVFVLCMPFYFFFAIQFYSSFGDFIFSVNNAFHGEAEFYLPREEQRAGSKALLYLIACAAVSTVVYKLALMLI